MSYALLSGYGSAFGAPDCAPDHYDPDTDSCFSCEPGWVFDARFNTCFAPAPGETAGRAASAGGPSGAAVAVGVGVPLALLLLL